MIDRPTDQLVAEHERILRLLDVLERLAELAEDGEPPLDDISTALVAVREFADGCHHGKEEDLLFPALQECGMPAQGGPIACMLHEHEEGRAAVDIMTDGLEEMSAGAADGARTFAAGVAAYVGLLRQHIHKENQVLFPMAEGLLDPARKAALLESFARVESEDVGRERLEALRGSIDDLATRWLGEAAARAS